MRTAIFTFFILGLLSCGESEKNTQENMEEEALRIHKKVVTIDTHADINVKNFTDSMNYLQNLDTQVNLPKMEEGGLDVAWFIVYTAQDSLNDEGYAIAYDNAISKFNAIHKLCNEIAPERIELALNSEDVERITGKGKKVAMIGVENAYPVGEDLKRIEEFHQLGARYMSLSHNGHSQFSDSNTGEKDKIWLHNGLSEIGKEAVKEMNRLGIMIDISHPSKAAMEQMISLSEAPIIASHSSARALCDHSRNLDDEQLLLLKQHDGLVQTVAFASYLHTEKSKAKAEYMRNVHRQIADSLGMHWYERSELKNLSDEEKDTYYANYPKVVSIAKEVISTRQDVPEGVGVRDLVDHIDYMVQLIGIDHVGISSDFDGGGGIEGWSDASETFNVTLELVKRGYTEEEITKLWGANLMRVLDEVQKVAAEWTDIHP